MSVDVRIENMRRERSPPILGVKTEGPEHPQPSAPIVHVKDVQESPNKMANQPAECQVSTPVESAFMEKLINVCAPLSMVL